MSFCSSPDRKTIFLPASGFGAFVGPCQVVCGPAYLATAALASDTASAMAGATANIPASATAPVSMAKWLTSTFMLLSSHFSSSRLRAEQDSFSRLPVDADRVRVAHYIRCAATVVEQDLSHPKTRETRLSVQPGTPRSSGFPKQWPSGVAQHSSNSGPSAHVLVESG